MKYLVSSFGSAGDALPTLAVGAELKRAGHDVVFVANPFHEAQAKNAGLPFIPAGERTELYRTLEENPVFRHPLRSGRRLWDDFAAPNTVATYRVVKSLVAVERPDAVIGNNVSFGALWAAMEVGVPAVLVSATPFAWVNPRVPGIFTDFTPPQWIAGPLSRLVQRVLVRVITSALRTLAKQVGTTVGDASFGGFERSLALHLGMWSPTIRPLEVGDPPNATVCGTARGGHLGAAELALDPRVEAFLSAGPPPVVVGLGSVFSLISGDLLQRCAEACSDLGLRCLIVGHPSKVGRFPDNTLAVPYAPYHLVFPRAAAVFTHGGAGTTAEALKAGRPTLVLPFGYDQFAFAAHIEQLGSGIWVHKSQRTRVQLREAIARAVGDAAMVERAGLVGRQLAAERDGAEVAAELIERLSVGKQAGLK